MLVSIVIPAYNEVLFIEQVVRHVFATPLEKEVIVVDNGSTDGTGQMLERLRSELPFRLVSQPKNLGKGGALRLAFPLCRGEAILIQDADLEYDPQDFPALIAPIASGRAPIVYGSRFLGPHRASYFWHRFGNWLITTTLNVLFNASLTDVETGYKVFRTDLLQSLHLRADRFDIEVEMTSKLLRGGHTIFEVPISYYGRTYAEGKKITWRDGIHALWVILCCRLNPWY